MLVSFALGHANFLRRPCTFLFFGVDFFALGSKRKPNYQWNIGGVGCFVKLHIHFPSSSVAKDTRVGATEYVYVI